MLRAVKDRKYAYILLAASAVVLSAGLILKPARTEQKSPPSETELAQLRQRAQERRLRDLSSYLTDAAGNAAPSLAFVRPGEESGLIWKSGALILTAPAPADRRDPWTVTAPDGQASPLTRVPLPPGAPFFAFSRGAASEPSDSRRTNWPASLGDWVLATARNADGGLVFAHGLYQGVVSSRCGSFAYESVQTSAPLSASLLGGGVFTIDGQLLGLISECHQTPIVISVETIAQALRQPPSVDGLLEERFGVRAADTANGVQVTAVWADSRAEAAGIHPGDILETADTEAIGSKNDLKALLTNDNVRHKLGILRGRRRISIELSPDSQPPADQAPYGLRLEELPQEHRVGVGAVTANSSAAHAGVLPGDMLLRIGGTPALDLKSALRLLSDSKTPRVLTLERDGRQFEILVEHE
jgi:S1-C subfamily serine protease